MAQLVCSWINVDYFQHVDIKHWQLFAMWCLVLYEKCLRYLPCHYFFFSCLLFSFPICQTRHSTPPHFYIFPCISLSTWPYAIITCHPAVFIIILLSAKVNSLCLHQDFFPLSSSYLSAISLLLQWCCLCHFSLLPYATVARHMISFKACHLFLVWLQVTLWATTRAGPSLRKTETMTLLWLTVPCLTKEPGGTRTATGPTSMANMENPDIVRSVPCKMHWLIKQQV